MIFQTLASRNFLELDLFKFYLNTPALESRTYDAWLRGHNRQPLLFLCREKTGTTVMEIHLEI